MQTSLANYVWKIRQAVFWFFIWRTSLAVTWLQNDMVKAIRSKNRVDPIAPVGSNGTTDLWFATKVSYLLYLHEFLTHVPRNYWQKDVCYSCITCRAEMRYVFTQGFRPLSHLSSAQTVRHIEAETKWPPFRWGIFKFIFGTTCVLNCFKYHWNVFLRFKSTIFHYC